MIEVTFDYKNEIIVVKIEETNCLFKTQDFGGAFSPLEYLRIDKAGSIKEFPDLKGNSDWRQITLQRFKEKLRSLKTETDRMKYIINDLKKYGYVPQYYQRAGHRPIKIKNEK